MESTKLMRRLAEDRLTTVIFIIATAVGLAVGILFIAANSPAAYLPYVAGIAVGIAFLSGAAFALRGRRGAAPEAGTIEKMQEESDSARIRTAACLATQIAHEVLNPVAAISGSAQLLGHLTRKARHGDLRSIELLDRERDALCRSIVEESARLDGIVSRFLSFASLSEENVRQAMQFDAARPVTPPVEKSESPLAVR